MPRIKSDEYLYSTARFRAKAAALPNQEMLNRLAETDRIDDCVRQLAEVGIVIERDEGGNLCVESALDRYLADCFNEVARCLPDPSIVDIFRYPYDAHNVKALLKSRVRGTDPFPLLMGMGTVSPDDAELSVRTGNYEPFSPKIGASIEQAITLYSQSNDPQLLDAVVVAACYADMLERAKPFGAYLMNAVQTKIDSINILTALRILRMGGYSAGYYAQHFIPGGKLDEEMMLKAFEAGERGIIQALIRTDYSALSDAFSSADEARLAEWEAACDKCYRKAIRQADGILAGYEPIFAYLADRENEVKNVRILLTAKQAGLDAARTKALLVSSI